MNFKKWLCELMEPNLFTNKDPATTVIQNARKLADERERQKKGTPLGMANHVAVGAYPILSLPKKSKR